MGNPYIEVIIPYEPCCKLGYAYNRAMEKAEDWVLFLDHDVFLCNPNWYELLLHVISKVGHSVGVISGITNRIPSIIQNSNNYLKEVPKSNVLDDHILYSKKIWEKYKFQYIIKEGKSDLCGFTILTHKEAWKKAGGFQNKFHVDCHYGWDVQAAGFKVCIVPSFYVYHLESEKVRLWDWNQWSNFTQEFRIIGT
jgi:Predicted glycosyltransferases